MDQLVAVDHCGCVSWRLRRPRQPQSQQSGVNSIPLQLCLALLESPNRWAYGWLSFALRCRNNDSYSHRSNLQLRICQVNSRPNENIASTEIYEKVTEATDTNSCRICISKSVQGYRRIRRQGGILREHHACEFSTKGLVAGVAASRSWLVG